VLGYAGARPRSWLIRKGLPAEERTTVEHVRRYLDRADGFPRRAEGERVLLEHVPRDARRILDLGTGDGRLLALLRIDRPEMHGVGLDLSEPMLKAARKHFADDDRIELVKHDLPPSRHWPSTTSSTSAAV
jgi:SAM-dependent methyltransferase